MIRQHGGCLCGAIRFHAVAEPVRVTICHCTFCQRLTGSAFLVEPIFREADLVFEGATPKVFARRSDGSGQQVLVHFCAACGANLCLRFERFPELVGLCAGAFDDPNWFDRGPQRTWHIFTRFAQDGVVLPAGIGTYADHAIGLDGTPNEAHVHAEPQMVRRAGR